MIERFSRSSQRGAITSARIFINSSINPILARSVRRRIPSYSRPQEYDPCDVTSRDKLTTSIGFDYERSLPVITGC